MVLLLFIYIEIWTVEIEQAMGKFVVRQCPYSQITRPLVEESHPRHASTDFSTWSSLLLPSTKIQISTFFENLSFLLTYAGP